jgi:pimeloyl-ACP methyl ester carboxylesterase
MDSVLVLVHSPSVGPLTWAPVADRLRRRGHDVVVPSLVDVADAVPPFWPAVVAAVRTASSVLRPGQQVVLVAHSNAGLFVPQLVVDLAPSVRACVFVDAALPARAGGTPVVPAEFLDVLRGMAINGRLPPWTDWWDDEDVAPMFPDRPTRAAVSAEQPRLPLAYYEQKVPAPAGWDAVPCGYLLFGPPYDVIAADARNRGLLVDELPGLHLHQLVEPQTVADRLVAMTERLTIRG